MSGETLNPTAPPRIAPRAPRLPKSLLYSIFARIGGWGLDTDAFETLLASYRGGFLGKAIAYDNRQNEIPASKSNPCAGIRCGCFRRSTDLIIMARRKNTLIGSHRASSGRASTICFTAGRAIAWNPCASRRGKEFLRS